MAKVHCLIFLLAVACDPGGVGSGATAAPAVAPSSWAERFSLVRADLEQLETAHAAKDQDSAVASWEQAYRQRFEPLIEGPVGDAVDSHLITAVEYEFGRVLHGLDSPRPAPVQAGLVALRERLDALELAVAQLPEPGN